MCNRTIFCTNVLVEPNTVGDSVRNAAVPSDESINECTNTNNQWSRIALHTMTSDAVPVCKCP